MKTNIENRLSPEEIERSLQSVFDAVTDGIIIDDLDTGIVVAANPSACAMHGCTRDEFIGAPLNTFIHPGSQHLLAKYGQSCQSDGEAGPPILHRRRDGSTFHAEWHVTPFVYGGRPCAVRILIDVSKQLRAERLLNQSSEAYAYEQETLLEISRTYASTLDFQPDLMLDQLRQIIDYAHGAVFVLEGAILVTKTVRGMPEYEQNQSFRIPVHDLEGLTKLIESHKAIRISDIWGHQQQAEFLRALLQTEGGILIEDMKSWLWAPLAVKSRAIGVIGLAHRDRDFFTTHQAALVLTVAHEAAIALVNAELYENAQALAVLEERQRLARHLHDAINQSLFSAGLIAEVIPALWEKDQQQARDSLEDLRSLIRGAMSEMRALLGELRPGSLTDTDLGELVQLLATSFTGRTNIPVEVDLTGERVLSDDAQVAFYRVCQEALSNVAKHAQATSVEISLRRKPGDVRLIVRDNGRGFDPNEPLTGHFGLSMMRERLERVGAEMSIKSKPGQGTELTMQWTKKSV